jgi:pimeloyl-ACP methyl ester carboxylesterase
MQTTTSKDGTRIAFWRSGSGPPLVLVHGMTADHTTTWRFVLDDLNKHFTTYAMDRRGRGGSDDAPDYDLTREAEDIAAVVDAIGEPVNLIGHSQGAFYALEAALLTPNIRQMILYEGVPIRGAELFKDGIIDRFETMLASGDIEGLLITMFRELVEMPEEEFEFLRSQRDAWQVRLKNAPTIPRELRALGQYVFTPERFENMHTRTLLLVGSESPPREHEAAAAIANALPDARVSALAGQQHAAMYTAPDLFVSETVKFFGE